MSPYQNVGAYLIWSKCNNSEKLLRIQESCIASIFITCFGITKNMLGRVNLSKVLDTHV